MMALNWQQELGWGAAQLDEMRMMGYAYIKEGKWEEAIILFKALVALDPQSPYDWQTLGTLYLYRGEYPLALETLDRALELDPADELTRLNRAKALLVMGRLGEGLAMAEGLVQATSSSVSHSAEALLLAYSPS